MGKTLRHWLVASSIFHVISLTVFASAPSTEVKVCESCAVRSVRQAIDSVSAGGTVWVGPGTYHEHDVVVDKSVRIKAVPGESQPVIDLEKRGSGLIIRADDVEVSGLMIKNSGMAQTVEAAGIKVLNSARCQIADNRIENSEFGVYLAQSRQCKIERNDIRGTRISESLSGNGIHVWNGEGMTIRDNRVSGNRDGIYLEFVKNTSIQKNISTNNLRYGLHFMYSHQNEYRENVFKNNECGVAVMYSHGVQMFRNRFQGSHGPASYGILLKDISDSFVGANVFLGNTTGIFVDGTTRTTFEQNLFKENGWALKVLGDTDTNEITRNDFIGNTFDVATNASANQNSFHENYWSRYQGLDLNHDGVGDEIYRPIRLSSVLVHHYPASIVLLHSLFFSTLDQIENAIPFLTPKTFTDAKPLMKRATAL